VNLLRYIIEKIRRILFPSHGLEIKIQNLEKEINSLNLKVNSFAVMIDHHALLLSHLAENHYNLVENVSQIFETATQSGLSKSDSRIKDYIMPLKINPDDDDLIN